MSELDLSFPNIPNIAYHANCVRCGGLSEYSRIGHGHIPQGPDRKVVDSNRVILCIDCTELLKIGDNTFWVNGWINKFNT